MPIRKRELITDEKEESEKRKEEFEKRLARVEANQKLIVEQMEKVLGLVKVLSHRSEGMFGALYATNVLSREMHSVYADGYAEHDKALAEIRKMKTVEERVEAAKEMNEGIVHTQGKHPSFLVYIEDLNLFELLQRDDGKLLLTQDAAGAVLESGLPYSIYIEKFFRKVYGIEVILDEAVVSSSETA